MLAAALDSRFKAVVLLAGGFPRVELPAEIDLPNFAPRVHAPTLLIGGDNDFRSSPLFRSLGVPPDQKRHRIFNGGHMPYQIHDVIREILDWFDRYLGFVTPIAATTSRN